MTFDELYNFFDKKWIGVARGLSTSESSIMFWRKRGYIPFKTQLYIEHVTKGKLKARKEDAIKSPNYEVKLWNSKKSNSRDENDH